MASVYRERGKYTVSWTDSTGRRQFRRGLTSKALAVQIGEKNEYRKQAAKHGLATPGEERHAYEAERDLGAHLDDFRVYLSAKKNTPKYIADTDGMIRRVFKAAGIERLDQIDRFRILKALDGLVPERTVKDDRLSYARRNRALAACKVFTGWLAHEANRIPLNPLARMKALDEQQDRRRVRVALNEAQMVALIETTATQPTRGGMTGIDRMVRYALGLGTGCRQGTLFGLKPEDFHLETDPPFIRVIPSNVKNRKAKDQVISRELSDMLRPWLGGRAKGKPVFPKLPHADPTRAYRRDLKAIGVEYDQGDGLYCDQHAQRNAFITTIIRVAGLKVAQDLAGHSTPVLTSRYGRLGMDDYAGAVEKMPKLVQARAREKEVG